MLVWPSCTKRGSHDLPELLHQAFLVEAEFEQVENVAQIVDVLLLFIRFLWSICCCIFWAICCIFWRPGAGFCQSSV
jgi:hypothetical protein